MVIMDWIGLSQSASGLGWIGFSKMDPCPTLRQTDGQTPHDGIGCAYAYHRAASSDFDEILYTAADFELHKRHVIKNEKKSHGTDSEFDETYLLFIIETPKGTSLRKSASFKLSTVKIR